MGSLRKAAAHDSLEQLVRLKKDCERTLTEVAKSFDFTLPAISTRFRS